MISVSIVDDEKELRQSITTFVSGAPGFKCVSACGNAEAALKGLPGDQADVVLMDINRRHERHRMCGAVEGSGAGDAHFNADRL